MKTEKIDLSRVKRVYFVGIKGVAMTALAILAEERGMVVSGSDTSEEFPTSLELATHKIKVFENFDPKHLKVQKPDLVIYTGAHGGRDNEEVAEAIRLGIPFLPHGRALGLFMSGRRQISVAGSHGKTTTAAMIATILKSAGYDPSYAIGCGEIFGLGAAGHNGQSNLFVAEADEYVTDPGHDQTPRFAWQHPEILVVTNIDFDHPDAYRSLDAVKEAFRQFRNSMALGGKLVLSSDDKESRFLADTELAVTLVGLSPRSHYEVSQIHVEDKRLYFCLSERGMLIDDFVLQVPGAHNAKNASMAAVCAHLVGVSWPDIRRGLASYAGTKRRFEKLGEARGVTFYDDYAHHPREISATLVGVRAWYPRERLVVVFQPHTYSRTKALLSEFAQAFARADILLLTDIYASARESGTLGISGETLFQEAAKYHHRATYAKDSESVRQYLEKKCQPGDVVIFMGAGDIYRWGREIVKEF